MLAEADSELPYMAKEFVEGRPVDEHCRLGNLSCRERLELCRRICEGVCYLHSKDVVHCDLKPNNILVTADGSVKLIDFGSARILNPNLSTEDVEDAINHSVTATEQYASPWLQCGRQSLVRFVQAGRYAREPPNAG